MSVEQNIIRPSFLLQTFWNDKKPSANREIKQQEHKEAIQLAIQNFKIKSIKLLQIKHTTQHQTTASKNIYWATIVPLNKQEIVQQRVNKTSINIQLKWKKYSPTLWSLGTLKQLLQCHQFPTHQGKYHILTV